MKNRQYQISRIVSSITMGLGGFLLTVPLTIILGGMLFGPSEQGHAFFSPQEAKLFLVSLLIALIVAVIVGVKYYQYKGKSK